MRQFSLSCQTIVMSSVEEKAGRRDNFDQLHYVYYEAAPNFLRVVFYELWVAVEGVKWEDDKVHGLKLMSVNGLVGVVKGGRLQKKNVESGKTFLWDLSLLVDIFSVLHKENPQVVLQSFDLSVFTKKNLEWLKSTRNKLAHAGTIEMDLVTFQPLWDETQRILMEMGMTSGLLERPPKFIGNQSPSESTEASEKAESFKESGNKLFREGQFLKAAVEYSNGIELNDIPQELLGTLYANRSVSFLNCGDSEAAKEDAKSSIVLRPNWFRGYARLGMSYERAEKFSKAALNFDLAIHLGDTSEKTLESFEFCKMMIHKLKRSESTDPEIMRQKDLRYSLSKGLTSSLLTGQQWEKFYEGTTLQLCQMGHRYYLGREGCVQNYQTAADFFGQAAAMGDPEGLYNLGLMTQTGKGVERNIFRGHQLIVEASKKPVTVEHVKGSGIKFRNLGVIEAWHKLGMSYDHGTVVGVDKEQALLWYTKSVEYGNGASANNIAIIYDNRNLEEFSKAVDFWKLATHLKTVRGAENLADAYWRRGKYKLAQEWYHYALYMGSIDLHLSRAMFVGDLSLEKSFNAESFGLRLEKDLEASATVSEVVKKIRDNLREIGDSTNWFQFIQPLKIMEDGKKEAILHHRRFLNAVTFRSKITIGLNLIWSTSPAEFLPTSSGVEFIGLQEIFFKEIKAEKEDKVYSGRILKVDVIEDAVLGNPSICLLVEDANGDVGRLFVYNYSQTGETQEELGFGCRLTIIYPHYKKMNDRKRGLRVDDPQLIFRHQHLRNRNRCRYCGKAEGGMETCSKCGRATYCSKLCLQHDAKVLQHSLVCAV